MSVEDARQTTCLENGVRIVSDRMPNAASATVGVWIGAGARHETAQENGLAHFLEHMAFKGTSRRTSREIVEQIEDRGGDLNAYTSREMTAYHARMLGEDVGRALDIIADILRDPKMAPEDVELERGVILQEIGQSRDTPDDVIFDWAQELAYPGQAMGRAILGEPATVGSVNGQDLKNFMTRTYAPDRLIIAAAGAVDHDQLAMQAETLFGDMASAPGGLLETARYAGGERREVKDLEQAHLIVGLEAPSYRDEDFYAAQIYATILGGGMSSRLFQEAREKRGLCYAIGAHPAHYSDTGVLSIYAGASGADIDELIQVIASEARAAAIEPNAAEISRAKAMIRAGILMSLESSAARCERLARDTLAHARVRPISEILEKVDAVDADALHSFGAARIIGAEPTLTLYGPVASAPSLDMLSARLAA